MKKYLILLILFYSNIGYCSFWNEVAQCITDPCNCGFDPISEVWDGKKIRDLRADPICPPWNRRDGRDFDNCLLQFEPPKAWTGFYLKHCAEDTVENTYFSPKIRVRIQNCNPFACWSQSSTLNWDGECVIWPTALGLPLIRVCARVALPPQNSSKLNSTPVPADPGYTFGTHLNKVGKTINDQTYIGKDGEVINFNKPKLCAYSDPGLVNLVSNTGIHLDPMDWNPTKQPLHQTNETHPLIKVLIFLIQHAGFNLPTLLGQLLDMIGAEKIPGLNVLQEILKAIGKIFELFSDIVVEILKTVGSLNGSVDSYNFGCVEIPLGPYPPPFCAKLNQCFSSASVQNVCNKKYQDISKENWKINYPKEYSDKNKIQNLFIQDSDTKCVVSKLNNNIIQNVIRLSLDNFIPLCKKGQIPKINKCVILKGIATASIAHVSSAYRDTIKKCLNSADNFCADTDSTFSCTVSSENSCKDGMRIVYAQKIGMKSTMTNYYDNNLQDCSVSSNKTTCQEIWGINTGEFVDIPLTFPKIQLQNIAELKMLEEKVTLTDSNNNKRNFRITIARDDILDDSLDPSLRRNTKSICAAEGNELVGCINRVLDGYSIKTYKCEDFPDINCNNNTYFTPQFIAQLITEPIIENNITKTFSTASIVTPLSVNSNTKIDPGITEALINLAGITFSSFIGYESNDQSNYLAPPFSGSNSINSLSIHGKYKNDETPYDTNGNINNNAKYISGLEYINGKYIQGGTHTCLKTKNTEKCIPGIHEENCVLTKLYETTTINCKIFYQKLKEYNNLKICTNLNTNCEDIESIEGITVRECKNSIGKEYCYINKINPNLEVCQITQNTSNRLIPKPEEGYIINDITKHFTLQIDKNGNPTNYDPSIETIRDKTSLELGLCNKYPVPKCSAITENNIIWPETEVGNNAIGTCIDGFVPISDIPLERHCISNATYRTIVFDEITSDIACVENKGLEYTFTSDMPNIFPINNQGYNKNTKIANFSIGGEHSNPNAKLYDTIRCVNYAFNIKNKNILEYFFVGGSNQISDNSSYDDYIIIKINNELVFSDLYLLSKVTDMFCSKGDKLSNNCVLGLKFKSGFLQTNNAPDIGRSRDIPQIDIRDYLINGMNLINVCVGVVGGGQLQFNMSYKLK